MFRYSLRALLIVLATMPPLLAGVWYVYHQYIDPPGIPLDCPAVLPESLPSSDLEN